MKVWHSKGLMVWIVEENSKKWRWFARRIHEKGSYYRSQIYSCWINLKDDIHLFLLLEKISQSSTPCTIVDWCSGETLGINASAKKLIGELYPIKSEEIWQHSQNRARLFESQKAQTKMQMRSLSGKIFDAVIVDQLKTLPSGRKLILCQLSTTSTVPLEGID